MSLHNSVPKFPRSEGAVTQLMFDDAKMCTKAFGSTVPSDATAGYATGCRFIHTDGGAGTSVYVNEGTSSSCDFNAVLTTANAAVATADGLTVGGVIVPQAIEVSFVGQTTEAATDRAFFIANRAYQVTAIRQVHSVAAGGASTLQVTKDTGTTAPGAGTDLLQSTGFNLNATANTVQTGTLSATASDLQLAAGDRLSIDFANTIQSTAGLVVTVQLKPI